MTRTNVLIFFSARWHVRLGAQLVLEILSEPSSPLPSLPPLVNLSLRPLFFPPECLDMISNPRLVGRGSPSDWGLLRLVSLLRHPFTFGSGYVTTPMRHRKISSRLRMRPRLFQVQRISVWSKKFWKTKPNHMSRKRNFRNWDMHRNVAPGIGSM